MAAKKEAQKTFSIHADVKVSTTKDIVAENFEQAAAIAKDLKHDDFVEILGELIDYESPKVTGIWLNVR